MLLISKYNYCVCLPGFDFVFSLSASAEMTAGEVARQFLAESGSRSVEDQMAAPGVGFEDAGRCDAIVAWINKLNGCIGWRGRVSFR